MSTVNVTNLKHPSSSSNNIVLASDGSVSFASGSTVLQVVQHQTTTQLQGTFGGKSSSAAVSTSDGTQFTSFSFTPQSSSSKLYFSTSSFGLGEYSNQNDVVFAQLWCGSTNVIAMHSGIGNGNWNGSQNAGTMVLNGVIDSPGTSAQTVQIRVGAGNNSGTYMFCNKDTDYNSESQNLREVNITVIEFA